MYSIYHLTVKTDQGRVTIGACSANVDDAQGTACNRLKRDGYTGLKGERIERVAACTWEPGTTIIYRTD